MNIDDIDLGDNTQSIPLENRKSISILLGAGFSVPMGYPTGNKMNNSLQNFDDENCSIEPYSGVLVTTIDDYSKPNFENTGCVKYFDLCKRLIKMYTEKHNEGFDYELFYDFIKGDEVKSEKYQSLFEGLIGETNSIENCLYQVSNIYNQMIAYLLKDKDNRTWYDDEPTKVDYYDVNYDSFIKYLSALSKEYIVNVHTLNHDLLFESFKNTTLIDSHNISDGFEELGSKYYGKLNHKGRMYHCRLERYTGKYETPIRLYKLHGSLDYVHFHRNEELIMVPDDYVKIRYGIGYDKVMKENEDGTSYDEDLFETHADFLTGTTSKMKRYKESFFKGLLERFEKNLQEAEKLIIVGYGCKDQGINDIIYENFNFTKKPSFIVDPFPQTTVNEFGKNIGSKFLKFGVDRLDFNLLK
ncbi:MAG: SIR2 family protein [Paludibacteraceae bacterium]|nr:SIR2 family protein [Paludibacteraceae bacterium]